MAYIYDFKIYDLWHNIDLANIKLNSKILIVCAQSLVWIISMTVLVSNDSELGFSAK